MIKILLAYLAFTPVFLLIAAGSLSLYRLRHRRCAACAATRYAYPHPPVRAIGATR